MNPTASPELWRRAEVIFTTVSKAPEGERPALVRHLCGPDLELSGLVEELLAAATGPGFPMALPPGGEEPGDGSGSARILGPYRLLQALGSGGMSEVFEAERIDGEVEQRVAVKLLKEPWGQERYGHLLRRERQILASLEHPNIARFLDAGTTPEGAPFVVMELVRGLSITEYCDARRLAVEDRIRLFLKVCSAVELAHRNLVVHRDLKPANILVADDAEPKLLDFGIAKLLEPSAEATRTGERFHTPSYASPEQIAGGLATTATDVYSLGIILYRLLTGAAPGRGESGGEPRRPSTVCELPESGAEGGIPLPPEARAAAMGSTPQRLAAKLRGDLDAICAHCLETEPGERYGSVAQLREDLERHLAGQPVTARPQGWGLRLRKLLRRHRATALASGLALASLLAFAASTVVQLQRVEAERDAAMLARAEAEEVTRFLTSAFAQANPYNLAGPDRKPGDEVSAREILDASAKRLRTELKDRPELRARLLQTLAAVYTDLGDSETAASLLREALNLQDQSFPGDISARVRYLNSLGLALGNLGRLEESRGLLQEAVRWCRRDGSVPEELVATSLLNVGVLAYFGGDLDGAEALLRESATVQSRIGDMDPVQTVETRIFLSHVYRDRRDLASARAEALAAAETAQRRLGPMHPARAKALVALAGVERLEFDLVGAEAHTREAVPICEAALGPNHPNTIATRSTLGQILHSQGRGREAEAILRTSMAQTRRVFGEQHPNVASDANDLALALRVQGRWAEAEGLLLEALEVTRGHFGERHRKFAIYLQNLGRVEQGLGRLEQAEMTLRKALRLRREAQGSRHPDVSSVLDDLSLLLVEVGRPQEAVEASQEAVAILNEAPNQPLPSVAKVRHGLGAALYAAGQKEAGEEMMTRNLALLAQSLGKAAYATNQARQREAMAEASSSNPAVAASPLQ